MKVKMDVDILLEQKTKNNHAPNSNDCASARDLFKRMPPSTSMVVSE